MRSGAVMTQVGIQTGSLQLQVEDLVTKLPCLAICMSFLFSCEIFQYIASFLYFIIFLGLKKPF